MSSASERSGEDGCSSRDRTGTAVEDSKPGREKRGYASSQTESASAPAGLKERRTFAGMFRYMNGRREPGYEEQQEDKISAPFKWSHLRRFWKFVRPFRGLAVLAAICSFANQAILISMPLAVGFAVDRVLPRHDATLLTAVALAMAIMVLARCGYLYLEHWVTGMTGQLLVHNIRHRLHAHMEQQSVGYVDRMCVGRVVSRILNDTSTVANLLFGGFLQSASNCVRIIIIFFVLLAIHWKLTLVACFCVPFFAIGFRHLVRFMKPAYKEISEDASRMFARVAETFSGFRVVKAYATEHREEIRFLKTIDNLVRKVLLVHRLHILLSVIWAGSSMLGITALVWYGGREVMKGNLSVGHLVSFYGLIGLLFQPIADLIHISASVQQAMASVERIFEVLDTKPEIAVRTGAVHPDRIEGRVEFQDVSFEYVLGDERKKALDRVSFAAEPGQVIALVGPSGSGKTTIANLLMRFYDVTEGRILIDGHDIRDLDLTSYRRNIGMVLQDNFLFHGTIRENIAYGRPDATEEQIIEAAKIANAWEFIKESPKGLDSYVGERGGRLSGGQKQRIAIARAVLPDPRILILDEATSALDSQAESQIQEALNNVMKGRTCFVIAHRLSTITNADKIVVLGKGRVLEMGTHEELLDKEGKYYELFMEQYGKIRFDQKTAEAILRWRRNRDEAKKASRRLLRQCSPVACLAGDRTASKTGRLMAG